MDHNTTSVRRVLYRPEEAAHAAGLSRTTIYRLISTGELPSVKIGTARRITPEALRAYVKSLTDSGDADSGDDASAG